MLIKVKGRDTLQSAWIGLNVQRCSCCKQRSQDLNASSLTAECMQSIPKGLSQEENLSKLRSLYRAAVDASTIKYTLEVYCS